MHTPGPWHISPLAQWRIDASDELPVASSGMMMPDKRSVKEQADNARLIAAAPDLLAALRALMALEVKGHALADRLQFSESGRALLDQCHAAINRATSKD